MAGSQVYCGISTPEGVLQVEATPALAPAPGGPVRLVNPAEPWPVPCAPLGVVLANGAGISCTTTFSNTSPAPGPAPPDAVAAVPIAAAAQTAEAAGMSPIAVAERGVAGGGPAGMNRGTDRIFVCDKDLRAPGNFAGAASRI